MLEIEAVESDIKKSKLPLLFLEGESDNKHLTIAYHGLYKNEIEKKFKLSFHENSPNGSIGDGATLLNNLFFNFISKFGYEKPLIAIFDSDTKGVCEFTALIKKGNYEKLNIKSGYQYTFRKKSHQNVVVLLLPIPDFRVQYFDYTEPRYSYVSTELLYNDNLIPDVNRQYPSKNDNSVYSFKGKKNSFANTIEDKIKHEEIDFSGFLPLFTILDEILDELNTK
jgi:hypothetical protein